MPKIACPSCKKQYQVPSLAAGKSATCKSCGKKFRLGSKPATTKPAKPAAKAPKPSARATAPLKRANRPTQETAAAEATTPKPKRKFKKKSDKPQPAMDGVSKKLAAAEAELAESTGRKAKWGFQWEKVALGLGTAVLAGGGAVALITLTHRLNRLTITLIVIAFGDVFTMINGLMGDEGIW